jgi:hypothetical protein
LICAAIISSYFTSIKRQVHLLTGKTKWANSTYSRDSIDSFNNYVQTSDTTFAVFGVSITPERVIAAAYTLGTIALVAFRAYISSADLASIL